MLVLFTAANARRLSLVGEDRLRTTRCPPINPTTATLAPDSCCDGDFSKKMNPESSLWGKWKCVRAVECRAPGMGYLTRASPSVRFSLPLGMSLIDLSYILSMLAVSLR